MSVLNNILNELDEIYIVNNIKKPHDEARIQYQLMSNTVEDDTEFDDVIADYYNHHFSKCISHGGSLSRSEAAGRAKEALEREYRRKNKDKLYAYQDGKSGSNGGMRIILDIISDYLKEEAVERHVRDVLDRYVAPTSFEEQVSLVREIIHRKDISSNYVDSNHPERYARNYEELIRGLVESIRINSERLRRL